jgi:tetratricopeptide (TPR) repeat protein
MRKTLYFLLVILSAFQLVHAEQMHRNKAIPISEIHQSFWPNFCVRHLQEDPQGCSAWGESRTHPVDLELSIYGYSHAHVDIDLVKRLGELILLIPTDLGGYHEDYYTWKQRRCDYAVCKSCGQTVIRGICCIENEDYDEDDKEEFGEDYEEPRYFYYPVYQCKCTKGYWLDIDTLNNEEIRIFENWQFCCAPIIYHGYVDWNNRLYFRQLKNHLLYLNENKLCSCYWPQLNPAAQKISNDICIKLEETFTPYYSNELFEHFTPQRVEKSEAKIKSPLAWTLGYPYKEGGKRTLHEMISSLLTHAFFYTHYRNTLLDLNQYAFRHFSSDQFTEINKTLIAIEESIHEPFHAIYSQCLAEHPHPKIFYERGMVLFHRGETLDSLEDIRKFITYAEKNLYYDLLTSDLYLNEGRLLSECLSYDEAVVALTKAIEKDSANKDAYFERAIAYFEAGDFSKALSDYLASGIRPTKIDPKKVGRFNSITFGQGVGLGMLKGGQDSVTEFVPSLLSCFRGISTGIWAFVSSPIEASQEMVDCAHACLEFIKDNTAKQLLCKLVPELQECLKKWDQLDDCTKGRYIGYVIGKYGVDIFLASGSVKAIQLYRNLRRTNAVMTLETASISPKLAQEVLEQAVKQKTVRETILKSGYLKIRWGQQGKHVPGKHNYIPGRSILEHPDPQKLVDKFAGTGLRDGSHLPGKPGYKEIVNFGEVIGYDVHPRSGQMTPTTWGKIHYGKNGVHIVPTRPR